MTKREAIDEERIARGLTSLPRVSVLPRGHRVPRQAEFAFAG